MAASHEDLREKLTLARTAIAEGSASLDDPRGIVFEAKPAWAGQPVAFVFPGQGAQSPGMLRELAVVFPEVREAFEEFDRALLADGGRAVGPLIFPPPAFDEAAREEARRALMETDVAQPAVGAACVAMLALAAQSGLRAGCAWAATAMASWWRFMPPACLSAPALAELSQARGRLMREAGQGVAGSMAALLAGPDDVERLIRDVPGVQAANWNGPKQTVIAGPSRGRESRHSTWPRPRNSRPALAGLIGIPYAAGRPRSRAAGCAGSSVARPVSRPAGLFQPRRGPPPRRPAAIAARLGDHLAGPVRFADMIEAMHRDGARVFVEVGPGSILTPLSTPSWRIGLIWPLRAMRRAHRVCPAGSAPSPAWSWPACRSGSNRSPAAGRSACSICEHLPAGRRRGAHDALDLACQRQPRPARSTNPSRHGWARHCLALDSAPESRTPVSAEWLSPQHKASPTARRRARTASFAAVAARRANQSEPGGADPALACSERNGNREFT